MIKLWHATTPDNAQAILRDGIDFQAPRANDVGDFGWGFYLTRRPERARCYGRALLEVVIDPDRLAVVPNPYFLEGLTTIKPVTKAEMLFHCIAFDRDGQMMTCSGEYRRPWQERVAKAIRKSFIAAGWAGILTAREDCEVVIFTSQYHAIDSITEVS